MKSLCITPLVRYPNLNSPIDSAEEAKEKALPNGTAFFSWKISFYLIRLGQALGQLLKPFKKALTRKVLTTMFRISSCGRYSSTMKSPG